MPKQHVETPAVSGKPPVSPQAITILKLLAASKRPLSAKQIARQLDILPHSAHRATNALLDYGLIRAVIIHPDRTQPTYYLCEPINQARQKYMQCMAAELEAQFAAWFADILQTSYANRFYHKRDVRR